MSRQQAIVINDSYTRLLGAMISAGVPVEKVGSAEDAVLAQGVIEEFSGRSCGDCSMCCSTFPNRELKKPGMQMCEHACPGCAIYDKRPDECRAFMCFWLMGLLDERDRPDRTLIVVDWVASAESVAHEALGKTFQAPSILRVTATDLGHCLRNRTKRSIDTLSFVRPTLVHAGDPVEGRLVIMGKWHPIVVTDHGDGLFTYASSWLMQMKKITYPELLRKGKT